MTELAIRGGTLVDGTGGPPRRADVGVRAGRVSEIAEQVRAPRELDATGALVVPGFVDVHTHYDPQVLWDPWLTPSSDLGVTSVVAGNCGFSLAPCPPRWRESMLRTLASVEDMSLATLQAGIDWSFASYPEYLERVGSRGTGINFGGYVGHTALRLWVLGADAYEREATPDEIDRMCRVLADALRAGALGFSTDRSPFHRADGGRPVPSTMASQAEVDALMGVPGRVGRGVVQCVPGEDFAWLYERQPRLGRPITWGPLLTFPPGTPARAPAGEKLAWHRERFAAGAAVYPQVSCRPVRTTVRLTNPMAFASVPAFGELLACDLATQRARYEDPTWQARASEQLASGRYLTPRWGDLTVRTSPGSPGLVGASVASLVGQVADDPVGVLVTLARRDGYETVFDLVFANDDEAGVTELLRAPGTVLGLSDAGAHAGQLCDASMPLDYLAHWVRDRGVATVAEGVWRVSGQPAGLVGLQGRGTLSPGMAADLVVADLETLDPGPTRTVRDLPGGGERLVSDQPRGLLHVLVNGEAIRLDGHRQREQLTTLPGQLLGPPFS